jgi:hypothetical protein
MFAYTTITTDNDAIQFSAQLGTDGEYRNPMLTFFFINDPVRNWRMTTDEIEVIWDNSKFLIDELYQEVVKHSKLGMCSSHFDPELKDLLDKSKCELDEIKELLTRGIEIGFFKHVKCEFFS